MEPLIPAPAELDCSASISWSPGRSGRLANRRVGLDGPGPRRDRLRGRGLVRRGRLVVSVVAGVVRSVAWIHGTAGELGELLRGRLRAGGVALVDRGLDPVGRRRRR
jgi:hypothetical protein